jgi:hypothetical protein
MRTTATRITLAHVSDTKPTSRELREVHGLHAITPDVVAAIIAQGVFSDTNTLVETVIERLAERMGGKHTHARLNNYATGTVVDRDVPTLGKDDHDTDLMDVVFDYALQYGQSGYLVGLAVGLALGRGQPFAGVKGGPR